MGAWGHKTFENDDAADWVIELEDQGTDAISTALDAVDGLAAENHLEAPEACIALAAAEFIASAKDGDTSNLSDHAEKLFAKIEDDIDFESFRDQARRVISRILKDSELKELWDESEHAADWQIDVERLSERL